MKGFWIKKLLWCVAVGLIMGLAVMLLWNWLVPVLFRGPAISLWQAVGLLVLTRLLTGGWGNGPGGNYWMQQKQQWRKKFEEKWNNMTLEEQERLKRSIKQCHSRWPKKEKEVVS